MPRHTKKSMLVIVVALLVGLVAASPALAYGPACPVGACGPGMCSGPCTMNPGFGEGMYADLDIETAAEFMGMEVEDLEAQLWAGKTLADVAAEKSADLTALYNAVDAARYRKLTGGYSSSSEADGYTSMWTTARAGLNLRYGPGTGYYVYATVRCGTHVYATGNTQWVGSYQWYEIVYNGRTLWASGSYLRC